MLAIYLYWFLTLLFLHLQCWSCFQCVFTSTTTRHHQGSLHRRAVWKVWITRWCTPSATSPILAYWVWR